MRRHGRDWDRICEPAITDPRYLVAMILSPISGRNRDDISDDNPDDSYTPNAAHNNDLSAIRPIQNCCLVLAVWGSGVRSP